jgi:hypothetical protein
MARLLAHLDLSCREADVVWYSMSFPSTGLAGIISLMVLGCSTKPSVTETQWRAEKEYEQQGAREEGRIGYIGNAGATAGE